MSQTLFHDRSEAGRLLAKCLDGLRLDRAVIYALSHGGVPVAIEIAKALNAPVDLILVRRVVTPSQPEPAVRAVVDGESERVLFDDHQFEVVSGVPGVPSLAGDPDPAEIERWRALYAGARPHIDPRGRTAILVEDGLDTVAATTAAVQALRRRGVAKIVLTSPVLSAAVSDALRAQVDDVICLHTPRPFFAVGAFYDDFPQVTDSETAALLRSVWSEQSANQGEG